MYKTTTTKLDWEQPEPSLVLTITYSTMRCLSRLSLSEQQARSCRPGQDRRGHNPVSIKFNSREVTVRVESCLKHQVEIIYACIHLGKDEWWLLTCWKVSNLDMSVLDRRVHEEHGPGAQLHTVWMSSTLSQYLNTFILFRHTIQKHSTWFYFGPNVLMEMTVMPIVQPQTLFSTDNQSDTSREFGLLFGFVCNLL